MNFIKRWSSSSLWVFLRELLANPFAIGAAAPSSQALARAIANQVPATAQKILELGAGTGVITQALLERAGQEAELIIVERSASLCQLLRERFPSAKIIEGDAVNLVNLLDPADIPCPVIVSSLPLRAMPAKIVRTIEDQVLKVLTNPNGLFIQFTYDMRRRSMNKLNQLHFISSHYVWRNIPPARVDMYAPEDNMSSLHETPIKKACHPEE